MSLTLFNLEGARSKRDGGIAQLGEHLLCKQGVNGSIPFISTKLNHGNGLVKKRLEMAAIRRDKSKMLIALASYLKMGL